MNYSDNSTSHSLDVGVKCQPGFRITYNTKIIAWAITMLSLSAPGSYRDGDYRLVGGTYNWEGHVEIFQSGAWEEIYDSSWTDEDAHFICSQLQHTFRSSKTLSI